jgi:hypothetical protein
MAVETSEALLTRTVAAFSPVRGVKAIVLGGSRGRGVQHAASDYDIGLYYQGDLDIAGLEKAAQAVSDGGRSYPGGEKPGAPLMTQRGGWGPWVDGGGWLTIAGEAVDILYRDVARVEGVIADCHAGKFECAYHYGHPHAFVSTMYAGEIATCRALHDPQGFVADAKARLTPYPEALRAALIARFLDEARFFLAIAQKAADKGDVTYVAGCAFRTASCLLQVIFALNRQWLINEKGALALAATFPVAPKNLKDRIESAFDISSAAAKLKQTVGDLAALADEAAALS